MNSENEKSDPFLRQFMDETQARQVQDDVAFADALFARVPVPSLRPKVLAAIETQVHRKLKHRRHLHIARKLASIAAVAAVVLLAGLHALYSPSNGFDTPFVQATIWDDTLYAAALDADPIERELDDLVQSMHTFDDGIYEPADAFSPDLMELQEIESLTEDTDFWKG